MTTKHFSKIFAPNALSLYYTTKNIKGQSKTQFYEIKKRTSRFAFGASSGHEALSGQSSELSVARVNEADAFGNAEVGRGPVGFESLEAQKKRTFRFAFGASSGTRTLDPLIKSQLL
ncbi:MAG: hypothetical protein J5713_01310, partial [Clostridia bacterium]|nr:hypothetical protein [Clostridia bacterium]